MNFFFDLLHTEEISNPQNKSFILASGINQELTNVPLVEYQVQLYLASPLPIENCVYSKME